jgi:hypothetical protein
MVRSLGRNRVILTVIHQEFHPPRGSAVRVEQKQFSNRVAAFMKTPQSERIWAELETPVWAGFILSGVTFAFGMVMLVSIIWSREGCRYLYSALTLEAVRSCKSQARTNPDLLSSLICHGVITNPRNNLAAVLGSMDPAVDHNRLASVAIQLGEIYSSGSQYPKNPEIEAILREDAYRPYRRRLIPESYCGMANCYLFDVTLNPVDGAKSDHGSVTYAFVATSDKAQLIEQIPWSIAAPCVANDG